MTDTQRMLNIWKWDWHSGDLPLPGYPGYTIHRLDEWLPVARRLGRVDTIQAVAQMLERGA